MHRSELGLLVGYMNRQVIQRQVRPSFRTMISCCSCLVTIGLRFWTNLGSLEGLRTLYFNVESVGLIAGTADFWSALVPEIVLYWVPGVQ